MKHALGRTASTLHILCTYSPCTAAGKETGRAPPLCAGLGVGVGLVPRLEPLTLTTPLSIRRCPCPCKPATARPKRMKKNDRTRHRAKPTKKRRQNSEKKQTMQHKRSLNMRHERPAEHPLLWRHAIYELSCFSRQQCKSSGHQNTGPPPNILLKTKHCFQTSRYRIYNACIILPTQPPTCYTGNRIARLNCVLSPHCDRFVLPDITACPRKSTRSTTPANVTVVALPRAAIHPCHRVPWCPRCRTTAACHSIRVSSFERTAVGNF